MSAALSQAFAQPRVRAFAPAAEPPVPPHPLHAQDRSWPETNCYVDLWIELLHGRGLEPAAMLGFTLRQDFEGDQFTFFKPFAADLDRLYGLEVQELAIYDGLEAQAQVQVDRGRPVLVEVDAFHLPDTRATTYGREHGKTTIAILALDPATRTLDYLHNAGRFTLGGADYDGIFGPAALFPYAEFVKATGVALPPSALRAAALDLLRTHRARAPRENPVRAFKAALEAAGPTLVYQPLSTFHRYAFNTTRQLGANFELLGSHLAWLAASVPHGSGPHDSGLPASGLGDLAAAAAAADALAREVKAFQFQLARAFGRRNAAPLPAALDRPAATYDAVFAALDRALG